MPTVVVPFRGAEGKSRLARLPLEARAALARAMLADVLAACRAVGPVYLVAPDGVATPGVTVVLDDGAGQAAAVQAGIDAASAAGATAPYLVVNADLPCVTARDLLALAGSIPDHGLALAPAADGTTNALAFASAELFAPLYGSGSAGRFAAHAPSRTLEAPNLIDDVDTVDDLERLRARVGPHTRKVLASLQLGAAA
jgi:2-phospho-L-lactate/phosphoenolpyruvate guanylyltransferase